MMMMIVDFSYTLELPLTSLLTRLNYGDYTDEGRPTIFLSAELFYQQDQISLQEAL